MEREHQGCLTGIAMVAVCGAILFVAYKWSIPYLKCVCYLLPALIGSYIGSQYFSTEEQRVKTASRAGRGGGLLSAFYCWQHCWPGCWRGGCGNTLICT